MPFFICVCPLDSWFARRARFLTAFAVCHVSSALAAEIPLTDAVSLRLAEVREGATALTQRDDYVRQLSPFDRQARLQVSRPVSEQEFLESTARQVRPWQAADIERLRPIVARVGQKLAPWKLPLPASILLVKTSGREEGRAAYCRGAAIVLPENMLENPGQNLDKILAHELFHVLSNQNAELRETLYAVIGFRRCNEVPLPEPLHDRKITNPDAPVNDHYLTVDYRGRSAEVMPVLFSKAPRYDAQRGGTLFSYLEFKLLLLEGDGQARQAAIVDGAPVLLDPNSVPGFLDQVGRNTMYLIHPEEILADNFVQLLDGRLDVPSPQVLKRLGEVLQSTQRPR